jgi:hypothetical protein
MMIDFGQQSSHNEQEIAALFLTYLPLEPLPVDLANRLKARVLQEVKHSFDRNPFVIAPWIHALTCQCKQCIRLGRLRIGLVLVLVGLAAGFLYREQLLILLF